MIVGLQQFCGLGILHYVSDFFSDKIGGGVVGRRVEREVVVDRHESETAVGPALLVFGAALVVAVLQRAAIGHFGVDAVARLFTRKAPDLRIFLDKRLAFFFRQHGVAGGNGKV